MLADCLFDGFCVLARNGGIYVLFLVVVLRTSHTFEKLNRPTEEVL